MMLARLDWIKAAVTRMRLTVPNWWKEDKSKTTGGQELA